MKNWFSEYWPLILVIGILFAVIAGLVLLFIYCVEPVKQIDAYEPNSVKQDVVFGKIQKSCIEGHQYYFWVRPGDGPLSGMAPVLDDDGKPVKCTVEDSVKEKP